MRTLVLTSLAVLLLMLAGCGEPANSVREFSTPDAPIEVSASEQFTINLESKPYAGAAWQLEEELNKEIIELVGSEYRPNRNVLGWAGQEGKEVWTFKAVATGQTTVTLTLVGPLGDQLKQFNFPISVR